GHNLHKLLLLLLLNFVAAVSEKEYSLDAFVTERARTPGPDTPVPGPGLSGGELTAICFAVFFLGVIVTAITPTLLEW
ncbi:hypothetical protein scyTo_0020525, partial [Scyliorhinus torazame]|nr:hypothetical protein [Scyliorhinus torazame]